jgi:hypothetical protein
MLCRHDGSLLNALVTYFPEYNWDDWAKHPGDPKIQRIFADYSAEILRIHEIDNWYLIERSDLVDMGASDMLRIFFGNSVQK